MSSLGGADHRRRQRARTARPSSVRLAIFVAEILHVLQRTQSMKREPGQEFDPGSRVIFPADLFLPVIEIRRNTPAARRRAAGP
jgi:hypothetical protein